MPYHSGLGYRQYTLPCTLASPAIGAFKRLNRGLGVSKTTHHAKIFVHERLEVRLKTVGLELTHVRNAQFDNSINETRLLSRKSS